MKIAEEQVVAMYKILEVLRDLEASSRDNEEFFYLLHKTRPDFVQLVKNYVILRHNQLFSVKPEEKEWWD